MGKISQQIIEVVQHFLRDSYTTDFSEYTSAEPLSNWFDYWETSAFTYESEPNTGEFKVGTKECQYVATSSGISVLAWDFVGDVVDADILTRIKAHTVNSVDGIRIYSRVSGTAGNENAYYFELRDTEIALVMLVDGVSTTIITGSYTFVPETNYWVRFQTDDKAEGLSLRGKIWKDGEVEPATWAISGLDVDTLLVSGHVGFGGLEDDVDYEVDYFSVGIGVNTPVYPFDYQSIGLSKAGVKSHGLFSRPLDQRPDYDGELFIRWHSEFDPNDGVGVRSYGDMRGNWSAITKIGVKSFATIVTSENITSAISSIGVKSLADFVAPGSKASVIKWPRVGTLNYTPAVSNMAGEMTMDWKGSIYALAKLGSRIVSYGQNGVSFINPSGKLFGLDTIHRIGLIGRDAFAGTDELHFFIDNIGRLYQLSRNLQLLDYREYLSALVNPVLTWDDQEKLLYICDGTLGFVCSPESRSFGQGPINITGINYQSGVQYAVSPAEIVTPTFEIWTGTHDLGVRQGKNIQSLDISTNLTVDLFAAIRYKQDMTEDFEQTDWYLVDPRGQSFIPCYGSEFQFGFKSNIYEYFEIDYFSVNGDSNAY